LFFHIAAFGCKTFVSQETFVSESIQFGYWSIYDKSIGGCLRYSNDLLSSVWKFGRFVGLFGSLIVWFIFAAVMSASCFKYPKPKLCFTIISSCMGIVSLFSFLLLVALSEETSYSLSAGGALAIVSAFVWAGGAVSMFFCMNERKRVPTRPTTQTASNAPTFPQVYEPEIDITANVDDPSESRVDTQVERISDPYGNETVITTRTIFLPDGTKKVVKTIESIEGAE
jgi:hypothetical protein